MTKSRFGSRSELLIFVSPGSFESFPGVHGEAGGKLGQRGAAGFLIPYILGQRLESLFARD